MIISFNRFRIFDLEFFYLDVLESYEIDNIIFAHKEIIYREIYIFVQRINNYAHIVNESTIKESFFFYFRATTITKYLKKIEKFKRKTFKSLLLVDFIDELEILSKIRISKALNKLISKIFTIKDARKNRKIIEFL